MRFLIQLRSRQAGTGVLEVTKKYNKARYPSSRVGLGTQSIVSPVTFQLGAAAGRGE